MQLKLFALWANCIVRMSECLNFTYNITIKIIVDFLKKLFSENVKIYAEANNPKTFILLWFLLFFKKILYLVVLNLPEANLSGKKGTGGKRVGGPVPPRRWVPENKMVFITSAVLFVPAGVGRRPFSNVSCSNYPWKGMDLDALIW